MKVQEGGSGEFPSLVESHTQTHAHTHIQGCIRGHKHMSTPLRSLALKSREHVCN